MAKAVFIQSAHSDWLDRPGEAYHFPSMYLSRVARTVGDWVIFYQGRRGGETGYYAVQRVQRIVPDPADDRRHFALLDRPSELGFERRVPRLRPDGTPWETGLPLSRGANTSAVRLISEDDFAAILDEGLRPEDVPEALPRTGPLPAVPGMQDPAAPFLPPGGPRATVLVSRTLREAAFARQVKRAYGGRCAISGLDLRNGGGRPEVEAAHIRPVAADGPDVVRNGLALSGTLHWMFDRGLVSADDDGTVLVARGSLADDAARRLIRPEGRLIRPARPEDAAHRAYLHWHRHNQFKG